MGVLVATLALETNEMIVFCGLELAFVAVAVCGLFVEFPEYVGVFAGYLGGAFGCCEVDCYGCYAAGDYNLG